MKAGWKTVKLHDICDIVKGRKPNLRTTPNEGDLPYLVARYIRGLEDPEYGSPFEKGVVTLTEADTVIICDGSNSGEVFTGLNGIMSSTMGKVVKKMEIYEPYLRHFLSSTFELFNGTKTGSAIPHLDKDSFRKLEIPLPPLAEQKRIVAILDEAFKGIDEAKAKAEANISEAESLLRSHLNLTFRIPKRDWIETKLGTIGRVSMCKRILKEQTKQTGEIPFYKIGTFGKQPDAYIPSSIYNDFRSKYPFPSKGEILISAAGTIGRRVRYDGEPAYFQDSNIVWIENDEKKVLNNYLYHFYSACEWNSTSGATISRLYNDNLRSIDIVFPASLSEQQEIAVKTDSVVSEVKKLGEAYQQKDAAYSFLKASILSQAFAGELTA